MQRPASRDTSTSRVASATSLAPQALKNSLPPPKVPVPSVRTGTLSPEAPNCLYSMGPSLSTRLNLGAETGFPCQPELAQRRQRRSLREDLVAIAPDFGECGAADGCHYQSRPLGAAIFDGENLKCLPI